MSNDKKYPETIAGLYATPTRGNARSAVLTQENADRACAAIQKAVGGKIALKATRAETKAEKGDKFPDFFLEAVTADLLSEERTRMVATNPRPGGGFKCISEAEYAKLDDAMDRGDDAL